MKSLLILAVLCYLPVCSMSDRFYPDESHGVIKEGDTFLQTPELPWAVFWNDVYGHYPALRYVNNASTPERSLEPIRGYPESVVHKQTDKQTERYKRWDALICLKAFFTRIRALA